MFSCLGDLIILLYGVLGTWTFTPVEKRDDLRVEVRDASSP